MRTTKLTLYQALNRHLVFKTAYFRCECCLNRKVVRGRIHNVGISVQEFIYNNDSYAKDTCWEVVL